MMNRNEILIRKTEDMIQRSSRNFVVLYSHFLTPAEQEEIKKEYSFDSRITFDGGYEDAERRICRVQTDEYQSDDGLPVKLLRFTATAPDADISHRDVLGSLMGCGIKREMVGDIKAKGREAYVFVHETAAEYIRMNIDKICRYRVEIREVEKSSLPEPETERKEINVSSLRLDSICGECFGMSRTKAAEAIKKQLVAVNWIISDNVSAEVKPGDRISMRTKGKIRVGKVLGSSKKGRLFVEIFRYI